MSSHVLPDSEFQHAIPLARRLLRAAGLTLRAAWQCGLISVLLLALAGLALWQIYVQTARPVLLVIDGETFPHRTHQTSVGALLEEIGLSTESQDLVLPSREQPLAGGDTITILRSRSFLLEVDGEAREFFSHAQTLRDLLYEANVRMGAHDRVLLEGRPVSIDAQVGSLPPARAAGGSLWSATAPLASARPAPLRLTLRRAIPVYVHEGRLDGSLFSTAATVGEALWEQGIQLYLGDLVSPSPGSRLSAGQHIYIHRAVPVEIVADGRRVHTRTQADTVGDLLTQIGLAPMGRDTITPVEDTPVQDGMSVKLTRVREELIVEQEAIPFETIWQANPDLEIDQQQIQQVGGEGILKRRTRVRFEDGQEVARAQEDEWVDTAPATKVIDYGTKIVIRQIETADGTIQYWRHIRMFATSYTAASAGKTRDHPLYGITRLGWQMRHGIVAVDPTVVSLRTELYVPGYGQGVAGDTGGAIKGRRIDLGYEEWERASWYRWVDVYLLAPAPSADQIRWVLPNWPRE